MFVRTRVDCGIGRRLRAAAAAAASSNGSAPSSRPSSKHRQQQAAPGLVDSLSPQWQGFHRGATFVPVLPEEVAISLLTEAVPFHQDALLLTLPSSSKDVRLELTRAEDSLYAHMQSHFRSVQVQPMRQRPTAAKPSSSSMSAGAAVATTRSSFPSLQSPTESLPDNSLDVVCLAPAVFSEIMSHHPYFLTSFHRVLRPHGVFAITGIQQMRVKDPSWCASEYNDVVGHLKEQCKEAFEDDDMASDGWHASWKELELRQRSVDAQHTDIYLPFPNIKRRTFTTQYHLTLDELIGSLRGMPECARLNQLTQRRLPTDPVGVVRDRASSSSVVNPLEVLDGLLRARFGDAAASEPCVVAEVDAFVITCNWRRSNHIPGSDSSRQLEYAAGGAPPSLT